MGTDTNLEEDSLEDNLRIAESNHEREETGEQCESSPVHQSADIKTVRQENRNDIGAASLLEDKNFTQRLESDGDEEGEGAEEYLQEMYPRDDVKGKHTKHLLKRNRALNLIVQRQKSEIMTLLTEVSELRFQQDPEEQEGILHKEVENLKSSEQVLKERMSLLEEKLGIEKLKCSKYDVEARRLKKLIAQEIGDEGLVESMLKGAGSVDGTAGRGWKGRAQLIIKLKGQIKKLQAEVTTCQRQQDTSTASKELPTILSTRADSKAEQTISSISKKNLSEKQQLEAENTRLRQQQIAVKQQKDSFRARNVVLEDENRRMREQIKILLQKTQHDDELIEALRSELVGLRKEASKMRRTTGNSVSQALYTGIKEQYQQQTCQIEQQEVLISQLREAMETLQQDASQSIVTRATEELDGHSSLVQVKLLAVENERLGQLLDLFRQKLEQAVFEKEGFQHRLKSLERKQYEIERKYGVRNGNRHQKLKRLTKIDDMLEVELKLKKKTEECRTLQSNVAQQLCAKNEEIRILQAMNEEMKVAYHTALEAMKLEVKCIVETMHARFMSLQGSDRRSCRSTRRLTRKTGQARSTQRLALLDHGSRYSEVSASSLGSPKSRSSYAEQYSQRLTKLSGAEGTSDRCGTYNYIKEEYEPSNKTPFLQDAPRNLKKHHLPPVLPKVYKIS